MGKQVAITGSHGFIGKNITAYLQAQGEIDKVISIDRTKSTEEIANDLYGVDALIHLAGVNRPEDETEFITGNVEYTAKIIEALKLNQSKASTTNKANAEEAIDSPMVIFASSIQAELDNPYGRSKVEAEKLWQSYSETTDSKVMIYRLPNVFGKWCKPNYNSAVATFCYNITRGLEITVDDPNKTVQLVYIDDVMAEFFRVITGQFATEPYNFYEVPVGLLANMIYEFHENRKKLIIPELEADSFEKKLYSTYLSYVPMEDVQVELTEHKDNRGAVTELIKTPDRGQMIVNRIKPGITKGNHYHHSKNEKFIVLEGEGEIRFRKHEETEVTTVKVSGDKLTSVDIPPGYTHSIVNTGDKDMVVLMWSNEIFDPQNPDTIQEDI